MGLLMMAGVLCALTRVLPLTTRQGCVQLECGAETLALAAAFLLPFLIELELIFGRAKAIRRRDPEDPTVVQEL